MAKLVNYNANDYRMHVYYYMYTAEMSDFRMRKMSHLLYTSTEL